MRAIILAFALAVTLATTSYGAAAEKYQIDSGVWGWYQQYLRDIGNGSKPGAFVITKDGRGAFYTWCQDIRCVGGVTYSQDALNNCEQEYETECVVFAVRDDIKVEYEVAANSSGEDASSATDLTELTEPSIVSIPVSPEVKADIDMYLRNAQRAGRAWALAIATDGSDVETLSCQLLGNYYAGSGPCNRSYGDMQEAVNREVVKRCGGQSKCMLLYSGQQKQNNIEIVAD